MLVLEPPLLIVSHLDARASLGAVVLLSIQPIASDESAYEERDIRGVEAPPPMTALQGTSISGLTTAMAFMAIVFGPVRTIRLRTMVHLSMVLHHLLAVLVHVFHAVGPVLLVMLRAGLMQGMPCMGIGSRSGLSDRRPGHNKRNRAKKRFHFKFPNAEVVWKSLRHAAEGV